MEFKIIWSDEALADLRDIVSFIARDNPSVGLRFGNALIRTVELLGRNPELGRALPERPHPAYREIVHPPNRIIYHLEARTRSLEVERIWHGARGTPEF